MQVLTFDFHNTLANCDPWFDLEIRDLPWAVVQHLDLDSGVAGQSDFEQAYRQLRMDVIATGNEIDAYDSIEQIFDTLQVRTTRSAIVAAVDSIMQHAIEAMEPVPGAVATVEHLHDLGIRLGVVSSAVHHLTLDWILDRLGIAHRFTAVVTSASSGFYKSTPAIYDYAMRALDGDPGTSVHVGDSLKWDVSVAQEAGINAVWLQTGRKEVFSTPTPGTVPTLTLQTLELAGPRLVALLDEIGAPVDA